MSEYRAALYMRLSREDGLRTTEPDSIISQRLFLMQYARLHAIPIVAEFADSGVSGTKWERAGLQDLLRAIEDGLVNTILVKDLSRLSRDYLRTGVLLEKWFPIHGVRLIAVNDGVDTVEHSSVNDYSPIRAVMDDWYARDISKKVRAAIYARQAAGICTTAALPYGLTRSEEAIIPDPEKSSNISEIFTLYDTHKKLRVPAARLNEAGVPSPRRAANGWSTATIRRILKNPAYIGELHIHVTQKISHKCAYKSMIPASEQIVIPVPPIIPRSLYERVQQILDTQGHAKRETHWLSGKILCGACGSRFLVSADRLICGGRKRGNGCRCRSILIGHLLKQIGAVMKSDGIDAAPSLLPRMIQRIMISETQITVFVRYKKPQPNVHPDMWKITK